VTQHLKLTILHHVIFSFHFGICFSEYLLRFYIDFSFLTKGPVEVISSEPPTAPRTLPSKHALLSNCYAGYRHLWTGLILQILRSENWCKFTSDRA
jgi:hypothetical protein